MRQSNISIIVPVYNAERTIEKCLQGLYNLSYPKDKTEIIFVDGGSKDSTIEIIKNWQRKMGSHLLKLIELAYCKSPGEARNAALKIAQGDFVIFTDADCVPHKNWIEKILEPFSYDETIGMVGGEILTLQTDKNNPVELFCKETKFLSVSGRCNLTQKGYYPMIKKNLPHEVNGNIHSPFFATANVCVSKEALNAVGRKFWDEITGEDVDFSIRINKAGYKLYFQPEAIVEHMHRVNLNDYCKQVFGYGFGHPLLLKKHSQEKLLEICFQYFGNIYLSIPFFCKGIIYIGNFHLMHMSILFLVIMIVCRLIYGKILDVMLLLSVFLSIFFALCYFTPVLYLNPLKNFLIWCKIRYLTNLAFILGGLKGSKKYKTLCIEASW